jgi:hypothetical protein
VGLIRKAVSVSTLGGVKYTSRREAQTKAALEEAKLLKARRRQEAAQAKAAQAEAAQAEAAQEQPWYAQKTTGGMISAAVAARRKRHEAE